MSHNIRGTRIEPKAIVAEVVNDIPVTGIEPKAIFAKAVNVLLGAVAGVTVGAMAAYALQILNH